MCLVQLSEVTGASGQGKNHVQPRYAVVLPAEGLKTLRDTFIEYLKEFGDKG